MFLQLVCLWRTGASVGTISAVQVLLGLFWKFLGFFQGHSINLKLLMHFFQTLSILQIKISILSGSLVFFLLCVQCICPLYLTCFLPDWKISTDNMLFRLHLSGKMYSPFLPLRVHETLIGLIKHCVSRGGMWLKPHFCESVFITLLNQYFRFSCKWIQVVDFDLIQHSQLKLI